MEYGNIHHSVNMTNQVAYANIFAYLLLCVEPGGLQSLVLEPLVIEFASAETSNIDVLCSMLSACMR